MSVNRLVIIVVENRPNKQALTNQDLTEAASRCGFTLEIQKCSPKSLPTIWSDCFSRFSDCSVIHTSDLARIRPKDFENVLNAAIQNPGIAILPYFPEKPSRVMTRLLLRIFGGHWVEDPIAELLLFPQQHLAPLLEDRFGQAYQFQILCSVLARGKKFLEIALPTQTRSRSPVPKFYIWRATVAALNVAVGLIRNPGVPFGSG